AVSRSVERTLEGLLQEVVRVEAGIAAQRACNLMQPKPLSTAQRCNDLFDFHRCQPCRAEVPRLQNQEPPSLPTYAPAEAVFRHRTSMSARNAAWRMCLRAPTPNAAKRRC